MKRTMIITLLAALVCGIGSYYLINAHYGSTASAFVGGFLCSSLAHLVITPVFSELLKVWKEEV